MQTGGIEPPQLLNHEHLKLARLPLRHVCVSECERGDLNPHTFYGTSTSSWRVCQFRHVRAFLYREHQAIHSDRPSDALFVATPASDLLLGAKV